MCVLDVLGKIKDLLGLGVCSRLMAVRNLLWPHQIHDQPLILQKLNGVRGGQGRDRGGVGEGTAFVQSFLSLWVRHKPQVLSEQFIYCFCPHLYIFREN